MSLDDLIARKEAGTAVLDAPQGTGLDALIATKEQSDPADRAGFAEPAFSDKPIEQWLPHDQAGTAQQLLDSFEDPSEERMKLSNALIISSGFGIPFNVAMELQPQIIEQMFGEELSTSAARKRLIGTAPESVTNPSDIIPRYQVDSLEQFKAVQVGRVEAVQQFFVDNADEKPIDVVRAMTPENFKAVEQAVTSSIFSFPEDVATAVTREANVRREMSFLEEMTPASQSALYALSNFGNLFNLNSFLDRQGLNPFNKGQFDQTLQAVNRVIAERPFDIRSLGLRAGVQVPKLIAEFAVIPDIAGKAAFLAKFPKLQATIMAGLKFGTHAIIQAPEEGETIADRVKAVGLSTVTGGAIGASGAFIPPDIIRVPLNIAGFSLLTAARGGTKEDVMETAFTIASFEALGLMKKGSRAVQAKVRSRLESRALSALRKNSAKVGLDLTKVPDEALKSILKATQQTEFWTKQFKKGRITKEVKDKRIAEQADAIRPILDAIAKQQPTKAPPEGSISIVPTEPGPPFATPEAPAAAPVAKQPAGATIAPTKPPAAPVAAKPPVDELSRFETLNPKQEITVTTEFDKETMTVQDAVIRLDELTGEDVAELEAGESLEAAAEAKAITKELDKLLPDIEPEVTTPVKAKPAVSGAITKPTVEGEVESFIQKFEDVFTTPEGRPSKHTESMEFADDFAREDIPRAKRVAKALRENAEQLSEREPNGRPPGAIRAIADRIERRIKLSEPTPQAQPTVEAKPVTEKPKVIAEKVKPVPPTKVVSPGQAGPFKVTFKATEDLPATRIISDPKVARTIQAAENDIAGLKTRLKQARVDKKAAVINATNKEIFKKETQIARLKERQQIKLTDTIAKAKERVVKLKAATQFKDDLRRDAISMIRAIPKELQKDFINRASKVTTLNGLKKLATQIEAGIDRTEKREVVGKLKKTIKGIKPKRMLPEFGTPAKRLLDSFKVADIKPETQAKVSELLEFARQVESSVDEDSVAWTKARHLIDIFVSTKAKTVNIQDLPIESIEQINEVLTSLKFQNDFETAQRESGKAETIAAEIETIKVDIKTKPSILSGKDASVSLGRAVGEKFITRHQNLESLTDKTTAGVSGLIGAKRNSFTQSVYDTINEGVDVQYEHTLEARDLLRSIMEKHGVDPKTIKTWLTDKHKFGDKTFTTNEMLSIFMHSRNVHNLTVMLNNGFNKFRSGVAKIKQGKVEKLRGFDQKLIDDITAKLTKEQKDFAKDVGKRLMDGLNRDAINETSLEAENLEIATVNNYWPAVRDTVRKILGKKVVGIQSLIEGMGILKERIGTGNPLLLRGFFETVYTSNKNVAAYKGLAIPLREVKSIMGDKSLQDKLKKAGYEDELNVMITQIERIEDNSAETGDIEKAVGVLIGGFAKSRFGLNLKIAPRQQISSTLIFSYVDPKYATEFKGLATKDILQEMFEISPQTQMRVESLRFDRDIGNNQLENDLMRYLTGQQNFSDHLLVGMKFFDTNAIADIYRATKAEVRDFTGLDENSDEFKTALKQRFEWVLRHTQPTWHPKDRSILGTSPNPLARSLTMFMSQREKLVMMVANANQRYAKSPKTTSDTKEVARTWGTVGANMAMFALFNFAWAALIHKRTKSFRDFLAQTASDTTGLFFFGRYIGEIIRVANARAQGNFAEASINTGPEQIVLQTIKAMTNYALAAEHFITGERYISGPNAKELKWKTEIWVATEALWDAVAGITGLPFSGPREIIRSIEAYTVDEPVKRKTRSRKGR